MKGYKAFDKDMTCRGFQYEVGKTYKHDGPISPCNSGFHFCENPMDVMGYYDITDCTFAEVEANGEIKTEGTKSVTGNIKITAKIGFPEFVKNAVDFMVTFCKSGDASNLAASGDASNLAASGYASNLAASGNYSKLASSGYASNLASSGYASNLAASGDASNLAASGDGSKLAASGDDSNLAASGDYSKLAASSNGSKIEITGNKSVGANIGIKGAIKGIAGTWITLAEYNNKGECILVKSAKIDGKKIKSGTWYTLKCGKFTEVK